MKKQKNKLAGLQKRKAISGYLFISPFIIGFLVFMVKPLFNSLYMSFCTVELGSGIFTSTYVGLENFHKAFLVDPEFNRLLVEEFTRMLLYSLGIMVFSFFVSLILNQTFKGRALVRAIFFLPVILNAPAITDAMELSEQMMNGGISTQVAEVAATAGSTMAFDIDYLISMFVNLGLPVSLLDYIVAAVARINDIIEASGVQIVIFIAALQSIPGSMYEVAKIEGATGYETFWKVTFPMVMPHIITNVVYTIVDSFTDSEVVNLAYDVAFDQFNYGLSSVFSLVSTIVTCIILVAIVGVIQKRTFYYN